MFKPPTLGERWIEGGAVEMPRRRPTTVRIEPGATLPGERTTGPLLRCARCLRRFFQPKKDFP